MLPKITDYWDEQTKAIDHMSTELLELAPDDRTAAVNEIRASVIRHVDVLDDRLLLLAAIVAADDLYKAACWIGRWDGAVEEYLRASAGTFWGHFSDRGFALQYLVDNVFDTFERPLELFPVWYRAAGLVYVSPQLVARELMRGDAGEGASFEELLHPYNREARYVTAEIVNRCHQEHRSFALVDADYEEESFRTPLARAGKPGILTVFRNEPATAKTKVATWLPA